MRARALVCCRVVVVKVVEALGRASGRREPPYFKDMEDLFRGREGVRQQQAGQVGVCMMTGIQECMYVLRSLHPQQP